VDIDPQTFNINPREVEMAITDRTKAIVATHVFGNPCDLKELRRIADEHGLHLVFDAAHAYGALYKGKKIGSFGDMEAFSLSGTKLVTGGEGGLLATTSADLIKRVEFLRNYGFYGDYNSLYVGLNGKMSELNAALACLTIDTIDTAIKRRNQIASFYRRELDGVDCISFQKIDQSSTSAYKDFGVRIRKRRDKIQKGLTTSGIQTKKYFMPAHRMPAFMNYCPYPLPVTEKLYEEILCLPIFNEMDDAQVLIVCERIESELRKGQ
jgi:dTDP-4-amino-4,6-dideoxygalactose transaminase